VRKLNRYAGGFDTNTIVVYPMENIQVGVTVKPGKASHGWLRVGIGSGARFYKLPVSNGQLDKSVHDIVDSIKQKINSGESVHLFWRRLKNGVRWMDVSEIIKNEREQSQILDDFLFS
jgi:hypothetical protein